MKKKKRVDELLVTQNLAKDIDQAKRLIMTGNVLTSNNEKVFTAGEKYSVDEKFRIKGDQKRFVSRGGEKLAHGLKVFNKKLDDAIVLDIGSSTGGFTDVSLKAGAKLVYALDVGTNQLDWKLRNDPRVVSMEQTNFRYSKPEDFRNGRPDFACIDVSFISLQLIFPPLVEILPINGEVIALIKPQFEALQEDIWAGGIVNDLNVYNYVLKDIIDEAQNLNLELKGLDISPIKGTKGNIEFLGYFKKVADISDDNEKFIIEKIEDVLSRL